MIRDLSSATIEALAKGAVTSISGAGQVLLVGEHAGDTVPEPWGDLGLPPELFNSHFGVDIGIRNLITQVAQTVNAPAVLASYSRIFLDYNRPKNSVEYCRPDLAGIPVPLNHALSSQEMAWRQAVAAHPLDQAIEASMTRAKILFPVHSFTPVMNGEKRDVDIGILYREKTPLITAIDDFMIARCQGHGIRYVHEEPYAYNPAHNETLKRHGYDSGRPGFQIEVRNDLLNGSPESEIICDIVSDVVAYVSGL